MPPFFEKVNRVCSIKNSTLSSFASGPSSLSKFYPICNMSARPRPVTATVTKPKYPVPVTSTPLRNDFMSLSEGSSTESLISILNHDSCESVPPSDEEEKETAKQNKKEKESESKDEQRTEDTSRSYTFPTKTSSKTPESKKPEIPLSPWESWLIRKAQELRIQQEQQLRELQRLKEEEERKLAEKKQKELVVKERVKEWVEAKTLQEKLHKKAENHSVKAELAIKEEQKRQVEEKAIQKFEEWKRQKQEELKEKKQQEMEKKKKEEEEKAGRLHKNEESFRKWLKEARKRPKSAPHSLGYVAGKLTGYYDTTCYPAPTYYNPIPWKPIHIPKPKPEKKEQKKKPYRWNPNKYL